MKYIAFYAAILLAFASCNNPEPTEISIVPYPSQIETGRGSFTLNSSTQLIVQDEGEFSAEVEFLQAMMIQALGEKLSNESRKNVVEIRKSSSSQNPESYHLSISSDKVLLEAGTPEGIFYGMITLRQLLPPSMESGDSTDEIKLPALTIRDQPLYDWRAMHLDVSRHFFSMDYLRRYVDLLSLYKLNKLHLHLTDDQGWRIEIKKYPELTAQGAWRTFNDQDSICMDKAIEDPRFALESKHLEERDGKLQYGGFYTQEELRELVNYAQSRHVEIIPEIDMPGHMMAAIAIYPELACNGEAAWGDLFSTPLCPVNEEVYTFVENVLTEVMDIFPSKYIHIGADEVEKKTWEESAAAQQFMKENGMQNVNELQSYFVNRVSNFLQQNGKEVVVWDDAMAGGIDSELKVMYWRNWVAEVPDKAVQNGNEVILAPGDPFYFSSPNSKLFDIYNKPLVGSKFPEELRHKITGIQACLWTETIPSEALADAMLFPNVLALAERAWSSEEAQDWDSFKTRLQKQLPRLEQLGVKYEYNPTTKLIPFMNVDTEAKQIGITLESEISQPTIYYTTDGSEPTRASNLYKGEFFVKESASIVAAVFQDGKITEPVLRKQVDYHQAIGKPVQYHKPWNKSYPAGDAGSMTDGYRGGESYNDGIWQGFTNDFEVTIDMGEKTRLNAISASFMQAAGPGVFMPDYLEVSISDDGENFETALKIDHDIPVTEKEKVVKDFKGSLEGKQARYIRVLAPNVQRGFIFVDELVIY
ncbi:hexosaminidase [Algoriphagus locisalis]|uniref:beta-N-acetylhexosaminidase n=1 Tax=Algoriphagus locisalis TaxID=305507 RepID=A0A1I7BSV5_9BACT|nr:glycoside hydrolase family 20 protein [Algoriphagus locisalis]SFT90268.1 hexosaminidase [Algoriphagus locisalis]